ncbi:YraN family protein [Asticcacaulis solisilvae]|uniref:YraN family protein n=1 Tax=Asticcacaulis solisilvae TaxID=1217274 RepID=UPI003FD86512
MTVDRAAARSARGKKARRRGRMLEYVALVHLMLKGYRILGFRLPMPQGEIDILAQKGKRLAVIEVKSRGDADAALTAVTAIQQDRLWEAGLALQETRPQLAALDLNIDLYTLTPGRWPRHTKNAFEKIERF